MTRLFRRSPRYLAVSLFCMLLSNAILIGACRLNISSGASVLLSAATLIPVGFLLQARITFAIQPTIDAFARYACALALNAPLSWLVLFLVHDRMGVEMQWAAPFMTVLFFFWNCLASNWALDGSRARITGRA